jgi:hypothetical protein
MNRNTLGLVVVFLVAFSLAPLNTWAAEASPRLLLRWQVVVYGDEGSTWEVLIYRDGLATSKIVRGGQADYDRLQANPGAIERLRAELTENHVGAQPNVTCNFDLYPTASGPYEATATWFGWRQSRFTVSTVGEPPKCTPEVENIALAVRGFLSDIKLIDAVPTVP